MFQKADMVPHLLPGHDLVRDKKELRREPQVEAVLELALRDETSVLAVDIAHRAEKEVLPGTFLAGDDQRRLHLASRPLQRISEPLQYPLEDVLVISAEISEQLDQACALAFCRRNPQAAEKIQLRRARFAGRIENNILEVHVSPLFAGEPHFNMRLAELQPHRIDADHV